MFSSGNPALIGTVNTVMIIWDAINDILIGDIADRTNTRMGKYRPHMLWGILSWTVISILMFLIPNFSKSGQTAYYVVLLFVWSIACTAFVVPWQSLNSALSTDIDQRNSMLMLRTVLGTLGATLLGIVMPQAIKRVPNGGGYSIVAIATALVGLVCGLITIHGARKKDYKDSIPTPPKASFKEIFHIFTNRPVLCVAFMLGCGYLSSGIKTANSIYFYKYVVGNLSVASLSSVFSMIAGLGLLPFVPRFYKKFGRVKVYLVGIILQLFSPIILLLLREHTPIPLVLLGVFLFMCGYSMTNMTVLSFVPDCADYLELHTGSPNAGRISSVVSFMKKFMNAFSTTIIGVMLALGGYVDQTTQVTSRLIRCILVSQAVIPLILAGGGLLALKLFPIKGEYAVQMRKELAEVRQARAAQESP